MFNIPSLLAYVYVFTVLCCIRADEGRNNAWSSASAQEVRSHANSHLTDLKTSFGELNQLPVYHGMKDGSLILDFEKRTAPSLGAKLATTREDGARELSAPSFTCQSMNETFNPFFMCSDVVDYQYYLPQGTTLDDLEEVVRATVPSTFSLMTGTCLSDYKKMMCSRVFLKCVDGGMC